MKQPAQGRIHERITAIAAPSYPAYFIRGDRRTLMIEAGASLLGPHYLAGVHDVLGTKGRPDHLFLTHSHWDHVGAVGYLQERLPGLTIGAHERVTGLIQKPSVRTSMDRFTLNEPNLRAYHPDGSGGTTDEDLSVRPFTVATPLKDGDTLDLGGLTCHVYETPGHTKDSLSFHFPEIGALFPGDACGVLRAGYEWEGAEGSLQVLFLSSYDDYVASIRRLISLQPAIICLAHHWVLSGADATRFIERSLDKTLRYRELIERHLETTGGDVEQVVKTVARAERPDGDSALSTGGAYATNLAVQVALIAQLREQTA